jgi:hypothetical protein
MDPVSLGVATAALLASGVGTGAATKAGEALWGLVQRLANSVRDGFARHSHSAVALDRLGTSAQLAGDQADVSRAIAMVASSDTAFRDILTTITKELESQHRDQQAVAFAFDQAKQVNIQGDNSGPISFA